MGKKNSFEKEKTQVKQPKDRTEIVENNSEASKKLATATKGISKEKKWDIGLGTTDIRDPKHILNISSTGMKFKHRKRDLEFTVGITSSSEEQKPGEVPKNHTGTGVSFKWNF